MLLFTITNNLREIYLATLISM